MAYLRQAAAQFGAQHITQLHLQESDKSPDMGKLSVKLVQLKSLGPEGPKPGPPMQIPEAIRNILNKAYRTELRGILSPMSS